MPEKMSTQNESLTAEQRDRRVLELYDQLIEIEQRLIPTGLHVLGTAPGTSARADMLRMVASFDRPEAGARSLPDLVAEGLGVAGYTTLLESSRRNETDLRERERVEELVHGAIERFIKHGAETRSEER